MIYLPLQLTQQTRRMGDGAWDVNSIAEAEFEKVLAVYLVPDQPYDESTSSTVKRAEGTLPRNLVLKPTQAHGQPHNVSSNCFFSFLFYPNLTLLPFRQTQ